MIRFSSVAAPPPESFLHRRHPRLLGEAQLRQRSLGRPVDGFGERHRQGRRHAHGHVDTQGTYVRCA